MKAVPLSICDHAHDPHLKIFRLEKEEMGEILTIEGTFCQISWDEDPKKISTFLRKMADEVDRRF